MIRLFDRRAGFTMLEVIIALALTSMLSIIVVGGMIAHGRSARANMSQIQVTENSRRFMQLLYGDITDGVAVAVNTTVVNGVPLGNLLTLFRTLEPTATVRQYEYVDGDNNSATITDNVILRRSEDSPGSGTGEVVARWCSRDGSNPIFRLDPAAFAPMVNVRVRIGDRSNPPSDADNALTGRGYQSFLVHTSICREEPTI